MKNWNKITITNHAIEQFLTRDTKLEISDITPGDRKEAHNKLRKLLKTAKHRKKSPVFGKKTYKSCDWYLCIENKTLKTCIYKYSKQRIGRLK